MATRMPDWTFSGSYPPEDVVFLLKPAMVPLIPVAEKERLIQSRERHYSEMLSVESVPDARYMRLYHAALADNAARLKADVERLADAIRARPATARDCVIVSLARAGTPIGVLLTRALRRKGVRTQHYSISIIRGRGIDRVALDYIAERHGTGTAVFVDGWTGKGAIRGELDRSLADGSTGFAPFLAVVADPAGVADLAATVDDYAIPSGLLNGIVSGLVSRSVLNDELVGPLDFHVCLSLSESAPHDLSRQFIADVEAADAWQGEATGWSPALAREAHAGAKAIIARIVADYGIGDINRLKPGVAEATRAILRRVPDRVLVADRRDPAVAHILHLAEESAVPVVERDLRSYRAITIIRDLRGEQA